MNTMQRPVSLLLIGFLFLANTTWSQTGELLVQGESAKLYLLHTVAPKENWYSIGRLYNLSPKEIAPYNKLTLDKPLSIGENLQIPLGPANFSQSGQKAAAGESLVPIYHVVQEKEWLYRVSVNYNRVPVESLEKWNNISKDQVKAGMHLIIGYLKVKTALSALANTAPAAGFTSGTGSQPGPAPENKSPVANKPVETKPGGNKPVENKPSSGTATVNKPAENKPAESKPTEGKPAENKVPETKTVENKPVAQAVGTVTAPAQTPVQTSMAHFNGGYFRADFTEGSQSTTGLAGTFKSTSGWQDGKYYALMNNMVVGTIIRVTVPATNKSIYAKVLGQLPDMKESSGLTVRISNAAANELGQGDAKFNVEVKY